MGKTLYLECYSGISGDMTVGALLDLGAREEALREALGALPLKGYEITIGRTKKCGIDACDFDVILEEEEGQEPLHHHGGEARFRKSFSWQAQSGGSLPWGRSPYA